MMLHYAVLYNQEKEVIAGEILRKDAFNRAIMAKLMRYWTVDVDNQAINTVVACSLGTNCGMGRPIMTLCMVWLD